MGPVGTEPGTRRPVGVPGTERPRIRRRGAENGEEKHGGAGVRQRSGGCDRYDGELAEGLKHGKGTYRWNAGQNYDGFFYKDYKHGDGQYFWPTGHMFTGKFYLNRKEGYGQLLFPDGSTFQGLYHRDQRFGPGVLTYPDGRQDVGMWLGQCLIKLCSSVKQGFSLSQCPEYAAFMQPAVTAEPSSQAFPWDLESNGSDFEVDLEGDLLSDESLVLPLGIEHFSTDGDHLPLPPGRRRVLDQLFYGDLWEPAVPPYWSYRRELTSRLSLQAQMQAHVHKNRLLAETVGWDVAAVRSLNREGFGPKGPLEVSCEQLIQHSSRGDVKAVSQILRTGLVSPDVSDSHGDTALIAATVNCQNDVIHLLLDMGADVDQLNSDGMSALAVCHVLYYPFECLHRDLVDSTPVVVFTSTLETSHPTSSAPVFRSKSTEVMNQQQSSGLSERQELTEQVSSGHSQVEETKEKEGSNEEYKDAGKVREEQSMSKNEIPEEESPSDSTSDGAVESKACKKNNRAREFRKEKIKENAELYQGTESDSAAVTSKKTEDQLESFQDLMERKDFRGEKTESVEQSVQVFEGRILVGSVQWKVPQTEDEKEPTPDLASACSVAVSNVVVKEELLRLAAEALSRTGRTHQYETRETVRKMAAMKMQHRARLKTLKLLLDRGADPNLATVPMPVLFIAIMARDTEMVRKLLLSGARTDISLPQKKGLYPLHVAAGLPGPEGPITTELLLHAATDTDVQASDQDDIYKADRVSIKAEELLSTSESQNPKDGGRTALHIACQRDDDHLNASKVVALLLSHRARTDLIWSGHSPLSLAIASGNDLAVEQLLKGGADPNLSLGCRVGSALCALGNFSYPGGNRLKVLDLLAEAGADILMPVVVGDIVGTAVDYAHFSYSQDSRISTNPFYAPSTQEDKMYKAKGQLLSKMGDLVRKTAAERKTSSESLPTEPLEGCKGLSKPSEQQREPVFKFCYQCGRSTSVKLIPCPRCQTVLFCTNSCMLKARGGIHKEECLSATAKAVQENKENRLQKEAHLLKASEGVQQQASKPLNDVIDDQTDLEENYSHN